MFKSLIIGASSGYLLKVLQTLCSLLLLPFIISDENLGLSVYGWLVSLLVVQAFMSMLLDGWRLGVSKLIGERKQDLSLLMPQLLFLTVLLVSPIAGTTALFSDVITAFLVVDEKYAGAIYIICLMVLLEHFSYLYEGFHHAVLKTWRVNVIISIEVFVRTISVFVLYILWR